MYLHKSLANVALLLALQWWSPTALCDVVSGGPAGAVSPGPEQRESDALRRLFANYWDAYLRLNPSAALEVGDFRFLAKFDESLTDEYLKSSVVLAENSLKDLHSIRRDAVGPQERLSYDMFKYLRERDLEYYRTGLFAMSREMPVSQLRGGHIEFASQASGNSEFPFRTTGDFEQNLERSDAFAHWMDQAISRMREGAAKGVVVPKALIERVLPQLDAQLAGPVDSTLFFAPILNAPPTISAEQKQALASAYRTKITTVIRPAYQRLRRFLTDEYLPKARSSAGLGALPGGDRLYEFLIRYHTNTNLTPAKIHAIGLAEVSRIMGELDNIRQKVAFKGTLNEFFAANRIDPRLHYKTRQAVLDDFERARTTINARLPQLFSVMPKADYVIKAVPEFLEKSISGAYYNSPAADGSRPGQFWVNTSSPNERERFVVTTTSLHEASPGHHFQSTVGQEAADLPAFRKFDDSAAYGEGWALYAESLGYELGLYADVWQDYGHLNDEAIRANRLVIDTGIHAMGWSRQQGIDWMMDHSTMSEHDSTAEVERYMANPGQALAYKIGQLEISRLRAKAQHDLGARFDVRQFHTEVLLNGSMPLPILSAHIDDWINTQRDAH